MYLSVAEWQNAFHYENVKCILTNGETHVNEEGFPKQRSRAKPMLDRQEMAKILSGCCSAKRCICIIRA